MRGKLKPLNQGVLLAAKQTVVHVAALLHTAAPSAVKAQHGLGSTPVPGVVSMGGVPAHNARYAGNTRSQLLDMLLSTKKKAN